MAWNGYRRKIFASKSLQFSYTGLQWCTLFPKNFAITFIHFIYICKAIKNIIISEFSLLCKQLTRPPEAGAADEAPRFQGMSRVPFLKWKIHKFYQQLSEAAAQLCSVEEVFLEISQNSQKYTCAGVSFQKSCRPQATTSVLSKTLWNMISFPLNSVFECF